MEYVLVFAATDDPDRIGQILVIEKNKPAWQAGRYNLVGGKIEEGESPQDAAVRELKEETGLDHIGVPVCLGKIVGTWGTVHCVRVGVFGSQINQPAEETEQVSWKSWQSLQNDPMLIPNLRIIVPLMRLGVSGFVIEDEGPNFELVSHTVKVTVPTHSASAVMAFCSNVEPGA